MGSSVASAIDRPGASGVGTKVVGGKPVPNGQFPFQAALLAQSFGGNDY